jgi:hypothetical protein
MRSVVSGRVINVNSENDYILAFLYRSTSIHFGVAGLQKIANVEGVDNLDLSKEVSGHLRYPSLIGKTLKRTGFPGIKVDDAEIEEEQVAEIGLIDVKHPAQPVLEQPPTHTQAHLRSTRPQWKGNRQRQNTQEP